jgi:hypothetical protein
MKKNIYKLNNTWHDIGNLWDYMWHIWTKPHVYLKNKIFIKLKPKLQY